VIISEICAEIQAIDTAPKKIRNFAITFFVILSVIGAVLVYNGHMFGHVGPGLGLLLLVCGIWAPGKLTAFYKIWMGLSLVLGFFVSRLILCVLFYVVLSPIGIIMRLLGKDILNQRWNNEAASYWIKRKKGPFDTRRYEKLY
jgi:hypothetical protein